MDSSVTLGKSEAIHHKPLIPEQSKCKSCDYLVLIIVGVGSLLAASIALGGYLQIGILKHIGPTSYLVVMLFGGGTGLACLTWGIVRSVKGAKNSLPEKDEIAPIQQGTYREISLNSQQLAEQGYYRNSRNIKIPLQSAEELEKRTEIFAFAHEMKPVAPKYEQVVLVLERDCLDTAKRYCDEGEATAVVLFAGPEEVGGGFIDGTGAGQEEQIIFRSDIISLMTRYHIEQALDPENFNNKKYPLFTSLIHTSGVQVFRNNRYTVLDTPYRIGILISAAPVSNEYQKTMNSFDLKFNEDGPDYANEETRELMKRIIYTQLKTAYDCGYQSLVLGAFGCGAFQNPAPIVAGLYKEVIETYFDGAFKNIAFAILDSLPGPSNPDGNLQSFNHFFPHY